MSVNVRYEANGPKVPLVKVERPIPEPTPNGVILKTHYAGICHSDVHAWQNVFRINNDISLTLQMANPAFRYPVVFGHEISGEVYKVGKDVTNVKVGDRVCVYPWLGCDDCCQCKNDFCKRCSKKIGSLGIFCDGGFQSHVSVPNSDYLVRVAPSVGLDMACMFGCSVLTAYNSIRKIVPFVESTVKVTGKANVLMIAVGGVGMWGLTFAKAMLPKAAKIICADITAEKLAPAKEHGADETIVWGLEESKEDIVAKTKAATDGGIDVAIDYVGFSSTFEKAIDCCNKGAAICVVGLGGGIAPLIMINIVMKELTILTIYVGTSSEMKEAIGIIENSKLKPPPFTKISPDEISDNMVALDQGKVMGRKIADFSKL